MNVNNINNSKNFPFIFMITGVWLILLALCALIGLLIVPVDTNQSNYLIIIAMGAGKVILSLIAILVWLYSWYKSLLYLLKFEFFLADEISGSNSSDSTNN